MSVSENLARIRDRIALACASCERSPAEVTLVAVTKTVPIPIIREAYDLGHRDFGESRFQEALPKIEALPSDARWHFIGKLQSNKARRVAERFSVIHSIENEAQLREIEKADCNLDVLIEVNLAKESQKSGISPESLDGLLAVLSNYKHARFRGLMTIGPQTDDRKATRELFGKLRAMNERVGGRWLSIGMSGDFDVAIQEGSTHVRVGTGIFGFRS